MVLEVPADQISRISRLELAESALHAPAASFGGIEFYPDLATKAAVLCTRLVKNHPLPDGNKRVGFVCMIEFCLRNGLSWSPPPGDEDGQASAQVILDLAAGPGDDEAIYGTRRMDQGPDLAHPESTPITKYGRYHPNSGIAPIGTSRSGCQRGR